MPAPRFNSSDPGLQQVFDDWADYIDRSLRIPTISGGRNVRHYQDEDSIHFDADAPASGSDPAPAIIAPWTIVQASYTGDPPTPADWGLHVLLTPGYVNNIFPSNMITVIVLSPSATTKFWLHASLTWAAGVFTISDLVVEYGSTVPTDDTGANPANVYKLLDTCNTNTTGITVRNQYVFQVLSLGFTANFDCTTRTLTAAWGLG